MEVGEFARSAKDIAHRSITALHNYD